MCDICQRTLSEVERKITELQDGLCELTSVVSDLLRAVKPRADPKICRWPGAATILGITGPNAANRARERIKYRNNKVDGQTVRTVHGGCIRRDLLRLIDGEAERRMGRGARIRAAIRT